MKRDGPKPGQRTAAGKLARSFGPSSEVGRESVQAICETVRSQRDSDVSSAFDHWRPLAASVYGRQIDETPAWSCSLADAYGVALDPIRPLDVLFSATTYYALLIRFLVRKILGDGFRQSALGWDEWRWTDRLMGAVGNRLELAVERHGVNGEGEGLGPGDLFLLLYQTVFPRAVRHATGEYYTPAWLARAMLDEAGYSGQAGCRLLDPACGSGVFLMEAIRRIRDQAEPADSLHRILTGVVGFDLNPLAVLTARANFLIAIRDLLPTARSTRDPDLPS